jgi:hypothetical protein
MFRSILIVFYIQCFKYQCNKAFFFVLLILFNVVADLHILTADIDVELGPKKVLRFLAEWLLKKEKVFTFFFHVYLTLGNSIGCVYDSMASTC